jgi:hypothetical protein
VPDPAPARKPSRRGLYLPFVVLAGGIIVWSGVWIYARGQAAQQMDKAVTALQGAGYQIAWKDRHIGGYPFRLDVTLTEPVVREPSGWGLQAPRVETEANMLAPGHWMIAWPDGVTFVRPQGGPVTVTGKRIRAGFFDLSKTPPSFDFEAVDAAFQPQPGAQPYFLQAAARVEFHLRAGPDDQGGVFLTVEGGKARPGGVFARMAGDKPVAIVWNATLSKMSAFHGADWADAVRRWSDAGGQMSLRQAGVTAGDVVAGANGGTLSVGADGRARGVLDLTLRQAPRGLAALGEAGALPQDAAKEAAAVIQARQGSGQESHAALTFQAGRTTLGPVAIGPAPKVYDAK